MAAYRFPYLLVSDSLVFKQDSTYYEHFYSDLQAWKHFVPVKKDLSDLIEKIKWAISHDVDALSIVKTAQSYARSNLLPQQIFCYHLQLLKVSYIFQINVCYFEEYERKITFFGFTSRFSTEISDLHYETF